MISLARYAALLAPRDMKQTIAVSMIGRLPIGITGLAILLLVQTATDSFSKGGAAAACYVIGLATVAPGLGRFIDRNGPRLALLGCSIAFPAALVSLVASVEARSHAVRGASARCSSYGLRRYGPGESSRERLEACSALLGGQGL